ncbi:tRNA threonylcarbamoyladenosine biosynthesis protein TsaE [Meinhardsimonia xiamenensis]|jgi:tRNA threonylcarbamoyladenosine biosynthesis protein TsaE|uniref:tRNA threonylcarbamoyladenosine biosynthesis protein TsaE n=1 Tax=Meinhardsimonia xiamenensis TaxID=990712 RepID=A0A1G8Y8N9_9RHOB|nr:tRNA (adenosine(37)-N6)-threonylcarbamoyltransferase complex ATPase subunit type 1 TsaE [Meinhardsimonia xiamenensis]PRX37209.1 tRNA threonylcarbamoyladenosine biosynthesis protein TsaE [Meinhardsimonia xiamenensis]SDJ99188.1 tRNA threonylcarbamoyladenosine biosynthesis protein TsaE [Meinhardsimonia xiamenensis]
MARTPIANIRSDREEDTRQLAARIAPRLEAGDVLLLSGPIGAGKSVFARALIQSRLAAAGLHEEVPSPTFTLVQVYDDGRAEIWHADLYRLGENADTAELGLDEAFESAICLVEWPERLGAAVPEGALWLRFVPGGEARMIELSTTDPMRWRKRLLEAAVADE